jgi:hypothetical protein
MHRKRLMMREANQSLRNRQESAAIHVPVSLNNVGPDNLAWFVEIASDHRRTTRRRMKTYLVKFSNREEGAIRRNTDGTDVRRWAYRSDHAV